MTEVVLVDASDNPVGTAEKITAHRPPAPLHRAFSLMLFDERGRMLLQQRSQAKYHFRGLWANSCCGHPEPGETVLLAAKRRCRAELGVDVNDVRAVATVTYAAVDLESGLMENEFDHILVGSIGAAPIPDADEISALQWVESTKLFEELERMPDRFAPWLPHVVDALFPRRVLG